jgi:hypothetical protein
VRRRFLAVAKFYTWNFGEDVQGDGVYTFGNVELKNYWTVFANMGLFRSAQDDRATRGGPSMLRPSSLNGSIGVESDSRKPVSVGFNFSSNGDEAGAWSRGLGLNVRYRPAASLEISAGPNYDRTHNLAQYVDTFVDPVAADTYGSRYVFSTLDQKEFSLQTRVNYVMSPKISLQVYMQPLVSVGHYTGFKQFARQPDIRPGHENIYGSARRRRSDLSIQRPGLQFQVAASQRDLSLGVASRLGALRRLDRAATGRELSRPVPARS